MYFLISAISVGGIQKLFPSHFFILQSHFKAQKLKFCLFLKLDSQQLFLCSCPDPSGSPVCDQCLPQYSGLQCDECSAGFFKASNACVPCECSGNADPLGPTQLCHPNSGHCLQCINNTTGPQCQFCAPGFIGDTKAHNCTRPSKTQTKGVQTNNFVKQLTLLYRFKFTEKDQSLIPFVKYIKMISTQEGWRFLVC